MRTQLILNFVFDIKREIKRELNVRVSKFNNKMVDFPLKGIELIFNALIRSKYFSLCVIYCKNGMEHYDITP